MPEISYENKNNDRIQGRINPNRKGLFCYICKDRKKSGYLLQCDFQECTTSFHVRCAMKTELIKDWEKMEEYREKEDAADCFIFC